MAAVLLKRFIREHWTIDSEVFMEPEVGTEEKAAMRALLVQGLAGVISDFPLPSLSSLCSRILPFLQPAESPVRHITKSIKSQVLSSESQDPSKAKIEVFHRLATCTFRPQASCAACSHPRLSICPLCCVYLFCSRSSSSHVPLSRQ